MDWDSGNIENNPYVCLSFGSDLQQWCSLNYSSRISKTAVVRWCGAQACINYDLSNAFTTVWNIVLQDCFKISMYRKWINCFFCKKNPLIPLHDSIDETANLAEWCDFARHIKGLLVLHIQEYHRLLNLRNAAILKPSFDQMWFQVFIKNESFKKVILLNDISLNWLLCKIS